MRHHRRVRGHHARAHRAIPLASGGCEYVGVVHVRFDEPGERSPLGARHGKVRGDDGRRARERRSDGIAGERSSTSFVRVRRESARDAQTRSRRSRFRRFASLGDGARGGGGEPRRRRRGRRRGRIHSIAVPSRVRRREREGKPRAVRVFSIQRHVARSSDADRRADDPLVRRLRFIAGAFANRRDVRRARGVSPAEQRRERGSAPLRIVRDGARRELRTRGLRCPRGLRSRGLARRCRHANVHEKLLLLRLLVLLLLLPGDARAIERRREEKRAVRVRREDGARVARGAWIVRDAFRERRVAFGVRGGSKRKTKVRRAVVVFDVESRGDEGRELIGETRREFAVGVRIPPRRPGRFERTIGPGSVRCFVPFAPEGDARGIEHAQLPPRGGEKHVRDVGARRESVTEPNRPATKFRRRRRR